MRSNTSCSRRSVFGPAANRFLRPLAAAFAIVLLAACGPSEEAKAPRKAFIERVQPADFYAAEVAFDELYSKNYDLAFLRTDYGKPLSALALKRNPEGGGYTLVYSILSPDPEVGWQKLTASLDDDFAAQVLRAVELKLHRNVTLSTQARKPDRREGDLWVFQRLADGKVAAALIAFDRTIGNPEATEFIDELIGGLRELPRVDPDEREELLVKLDRLASRIALNEEPQPGEKK